MNKVTVDVDFTLSVTGVLPGVACLAIIYAKTLKSQVESSHSRLIRLAWSFYGRPLRLVCPLGRVASGGGIGVNECPPR